MTKKKSEAVLLFSCPVCPAFAILRLAERILWTGAFLLRRKKHRPKAASERSGTRFYIIKTNKTERFVFFFNPETLNIVF